MSATTVAINNSGSTDHISFDAVGIPGFEFIQDPLEYETRTHHSNMDTYDHLAIDDLKQAAVIIAALFTILQCVMSCFHVNHYRNLEDLCLILIFRFKKIYLCKEILRGAKLFFRLCRCSFIIMFL